MTQDEKDLLLRDLCGRLHTCNCINGTALTIALDDERPMEANQWCITNYDCYMGKLSVLNIIYASDEERTIDIEYIKPYLFPLSSMTEEQYENFVIISGWDGDIEDIRRGKFSCIGYIGLDYIYDTIDWFNKNHFDYRGLIPMGLAIDATGLDIY